MSAKGTEWGRIQEIFDVATKTVAQVKALGITKESFVNPATDAQELIAEGVLNRVFRVTEELGHLDEGTAARYGLDGRGARGIRNRLAHAYGEVDREIVWEVVDKEFEQIIRGCKAYCDELGIDIE